VVRESDTAALDWHPPARRYRWNLVSVPEAVFSEQARAAGWLYVAGVAASVLVAATLRPVEGMHDYLLTWVLLSGLFTVPAIALTLRATRAVAAPDRSAWRLWLVGLVLIYLIGTGLFYVVRDPDTGLRYLGVVAILAVTAVFDASCLRMMRRRSARRSLALDVVEVMMAAGLVLGGVILLVGETIVTSPVAWFAVPCLVTANGAVTGLVWASILYRRMPPGDRVLEGLGITLGVLALVDCALQLGQALNGFVWPPGPLLAVHALTMGMLVLLPLHVSRLPSTGLDRTSAGQQVRGSRALTVALLGALPVLLVETLVMSRRVSWAGMWFAGLLLLLVVLTALRNLLALEETRRLYAEVTEAAEERKVLLADVMRTVDGERRQAATQLHRQAVASYSAFSSFVAGSAELDAVDRDASVRIRSELERVAEALGDLVEVVRPPADEPWGERFATVLRAHLVRMAGDAPRPVVEVDVAAGIDLDWTTETLVVQLLQTAASEALETGASHLRVQLSAGAAGLEVAVQDDGVGTGADPGERTDPLAASAQETMRAIVALAGGTLEVRRRPGRGVTTVARLGPLGTRPARPSLRVVPPLDDGS
jgi:hypothetical protein